MIIALMFVSALLLLLPFLVRLDGQPHAEWQQFLGRFHPLAVHIPIGLIVLLPILEIAGKFRPALREAAGFVLALACAACLGTMALGYLLAFGSGDTGTTLTRHLWGGIALTIGVLLCVFARSVWSVGFARHLYTALLAGVLMALVYTAHQGGSLTHGENYLTAYMPASVRKWMPAGIDTRPSSNSFYAMHIDPIFDHNCVSCHGSGKVQGGLRLDSFEWLMKGGKEGPVVAAGNAQQSILLGRITLPGSDQHFMPADGRTPLTSEEIGWIRAWIQQGASPVVTQLEGVAIAGHATGVQGDPPDQPVSDYSALMPEISQMQYAQGAKLLAVSAKPSDGLILSTVNVAQSFGDVQLVQFKKFAPYIVEADLGRTAVSDASLDILSNFTHLRVLHLEGTNIAGSSLRKLTTLSELKYLNLSDTKVDSAATGPLAAMKTLHHLYLFNTPAQPAAAAEPQSTPETTQRSKP